MDSHYEVDEGQKRARDLMDSVRKVRAELSSLANQFAALSTMKDGDGSQAGHFVKVVTLLGVQGADQTAKNAAAKGLYDEMNSALGNIHASLPQFLARMG